MAGRESIWVAGRESAAMKWYLPVSLALALGLAGCGGSGAATRTVTRTVTRTARPSSRASTTTTPRTTSPATTTSASTGTSPCTAADLTLSYLGQQGAAGHGELGFALENTSHLPCHTYGFPGVLFLDSSGAGLTTIPHHTTIDYFGHTREAELTVQPGREVSFRLGVTHGAVPGSVCTTARGLQVIPPDDTASIRASIPGGAYECRDVTVSPLQPGVSAYP